MKTNGLHISALKTTSTYWLNLIAIREPETAETSPGGVASTEMVCLVNLVQVIDIFFSQVDDLRVACAQSRRLPGLKDVDYLLRIRSFVTDLGNTTKRAKLARHC